MRLGEGWYLFGTRRVFARIVSGKLVLRVAGGWERLDDFVERHTEEELHKLARLKAEGKDPHAEMINSRASGRSQHQH